MKNILIVDDEGYMRRLLKTILTHDESSADLKVMEAENGLKVIELIETGFIPDLIISDVQMPYMDGVKMAKQLRQLQIGSDIIFMSGDIGDYDLSDLQRYSPHDLIKKPILDFKVFLASIRDILSKDIRPTTSVAN